MDAGTTLARWNALRTPRTHAVGAWNPEHAFFAHRAVMQRSLSELARKARCAAASLGANDHPVGIICPLDTLHLSELAIPSLPLLGIECEPEHGDSPRQEN